MLEPHILDALRERLDASRAALLAALEGVTERDFAADAGGETVVRLLGRLATEERRAVLEARGQPVPELRMPERPLAPQVVHDLAGARYRTAQYLEEPNASREVAEGLVAALEAREAEAAVRIRNRAPAAPRPTIPVIQPPSDRQA
jgi:hypothetical protein